MKFFSYDPDVGMEFYATAEEARLRAMENLELHRDEAADDGWSEEIGELCWGEIKQAAIETERKSDDSGKFDYLCEWKLCSL